MGSLVISSYDAELGKALADYIMRQREVIESLRATRRATRLWRGVHELGLANGYDFAKTEDVEAVARRLPEIADDVRSFLMGDDPEPEQETISALALFLRGDPAEVSALCPAFGAYRRKFARPA